MTLFDTLFITVYKRYEKTHKKRAIKWATFYVSFLQCSVLLLLGIFFAKFFKQMHVSTMSSSKAWVLFILAAVFVFFKNWMQYSGKKRNLLNAKMLKKRKQTYSIWILWLLPVIVLCLSVILFQAV